MLEFVMLLLFLISTISMAQFLPWIVSIVLSLFLIVCLEDLYFIHLGNRKK